jgi:hypothetical protein
LSDGCDGFPASCHKCRTSESGASRDGSPRCGPGWASDGRLRSRRREPRLAVRRARSLPSPGFDQRPGPAAGEFIPRIPGTARARSAAPLLGTELLREPRRPGSTGGCDAGFRALAMGDSRADHSSRLASGPPACRRLPAGLAHRPGLRCFSPPALGTGLIGSSL